ncbi:hypothetical protein evm_000570 [Chilo suppressalis]|nr:hypothetical protein evm_000570 [Chilo suppressalis]
MFEVDGKVVLVTGGAAGIGARIVKAFLHEGAKHVTFLDIQIASGSLLEKELATQYGQERVKFRKCDITTSELTDAYDELVSQFSYIDIVVNAAGILNDNPDIYVKSINVNVTALITSSLKAYELMRKDRGGKGGTIINISSVLALVDAPTVPIYCATKSAVLKFSNCLGMEPTFSRTGVRVVTVCFGVTDTALVTFNGTETFDPEFKETMLEVSNSPKQSIESAVFGVMEAYKKGGSPSTCEFEGLHA